MNRLAFVTDLHIDDHFLRNYDIDTRRNLERVIGDLQERNIKHVVLGGDIGEAPALDWIFRLFSSFDIKLVLGNHDQIADFAKYFATATGELLFDSQEQGAYKHIFLDTAAGHVGTLQLQWLAAELQTDKKILVFMHHPVLPIGSAMDTLYPLKNRDELIELLVDSGRQITIFSGHYHTADETSQGLIRQFVTPAVSFQVSRDSEEIQLETDYFGYRIIDLTGEDLHTEIISFKSLP